MGNSRSFMLKIKTRTRIATNLPQISHELLLKQRIARITRMFLNMDVFLNTNTHEYTRMDMNVLKHELPLTDAKPRAI